MLSKRLEGRKLLLFFFFETVQTSNRFFAAIASKSYTRVLATAKTSSDAVKFELSFSSCLTNVSARNGIDLVTQFWSLSHPTNWQCCGNSRHAKPVAMVPLQASRTTSSGLVYLKIMSCSKPVLFCPCQNNFLYPKSESPLLYTISS